MIRAESKEHGVICFGIIARMAARLFAHKSADSFVSYFLARSLSPDFITHGLVVLIIERRLLAGRHAN